MNLKHALLTCTFGLILAVLLLMRSSLLASADSPGDLDPTFGNGGKVTTDFSHSYSEATAVAIQPDGKIVAAGSGLNGLSVDPALVRYNSDGSLDSTFGSGGIVLTPLGSNDDWITALALQSDGKIVVAGADESAIIVARYNSNGALDPGFGSDGRVMTPFGPYPPAGNAVAIQTDGKIVVAGFRDTSSDRDFVVIRYNSDGSLDPAFGSGGIVITSMGSYDFAEDMILQPDGKIVVVGFSNVGGNIDLVVVRYNSNGTLDTSFDADGKVITPISSSFDTAHAVVLQADGKIVVAGEGGNSNTDFVLVRYNSDGSLDPTFGGDGIVTTPIGSNGDSANALTLQPDGRIVLVGSTETSPFSDRDVVVARYNSDGSLDTTFGFGGIMITSTTSSYDGANAVALQSDGKIVAVGFSNFRFTVLRYQSNADLDPAFSQDGIVVTDLGDAWDDATAVALQPDGKIVVAGTTYDSFNLDFAIARYHGDGNLDDSFGNGGIVVTPIGFYDDAGQAIALQADGKIVVAGFTRRNNSSTDYDFALVRYNSNGSLDSTFDSDGIVTTSFSGSTDMAFAVAIQPDGKIVVAGQANSGSYSAFALARYNSNGSLDTSFDGDGWVTTSVGIWHDTGRAMLLQPDGKIVVAGEGDNEFAVARYNSDGSLDLSFDADGIVTTSIGAGYDEANAVALQADDKIMVAGASYDENSDIALVRYNSDGSLDTSFDADGKVITNYGGYDMASDIALQPDGKLVVVGSHWDGNPTVPAFFIIGRYNINGSLDSSFSPFGLVTTLIGPIYNQANALALQPDGKIVVIGASNDTNSLDAALVRYQGNTAAPALAFTKTVNHTNPTPGQPITYTLVVQNNSSITITNAKIVDDLPAGLTFAGPMTLDPPGIELEWSPPTLVDGLTIAAGEAITLTLPVTVNSSLVGGTHLTNTAILSGVGLSEISGTAVITIANVPAITVTKTANLSTAQVGQTLTYIYHVTNTGNVTLTGLSASDDKLGQVTLSQATLAPNQSTTGTLTYTVIADDLPGPLTNTVVVTGTPPTGPVVTATDIESVTLSSNPAITVTKTANVSTVQVGQTITYTYRVTNTGNIALININVSDDKLGQVTLGSTTLAPNEDAAGLLTYTIAQADLPGPLTNTVVVTGTPPGGPAVTATTSVSVTLIPQDTDSDSSIYLPLIVKNN